MSKTNKNSLDNANTPPEHTPEKIAILGTGVAAMTSAFYLTDQPNWKEKYDITVYQMGWRAGGKGASGCNAEYGERIEEHGLHIWFGFYENAFKTIQETYKFLNRPEGAPLRTWEDAFKPHSFIALEEYIDKKWETWPINFPTNNLVPGTSDKSANLWELLPAAYSWINEAIDELEPHLVSNSGSHIEQWLTKLSKEIGKDLKSINHATLHLKALIDSLPKQIKSHDGGIINDIFMLFKAFNKLKNLLPIILDPILNELSDVRHLFIIVDLGLTIIAGMIEDDVFTKGFDVINNYDYKKWLIKHGANEKYTANSAAVIGFYDLAFAYEDGSEKKPNIEAGTMLRSFLKISLEFRGAIMYKMQAGMGDTIFAPFYLALKERGVKFEFFHKVEELIPEGNTVSTIKLTKQVNLKADIKEYNPLVKIYGHDSTERSPPLDCWPSKPNYDQIDPIQAKLLQEHKINLESFWSNWGNIYQEHTSQTLPEITLEKGVDFDKVIFGISVASLPYLCPQLLEKSEPLRKTTEKIKTVVTQAYQVWNNVTLEGLGWSHNPKSDPTAQPVLSSFVEPFDTWACMDQLICREDWPADHQPKNIAYFCNVMPVDSFPPASDYSFPAQCYDTVKTNAMKNLTHDIYNLWPAVAKKGEFNWDILVDINNQQGESRFDSQFWRANIDPSERYVQSVVDSTQYRLATDGSGFDNLYLTGDWIKTGLNVGCVEAATMAGMQTSRAICGHPERIHGEKDF
jgi:uncharacterized protein with NAD-binding domain and iron-sulfur cluster